jgi:hypothetical protein
MVHTYTLERNVSLSVVLNVRQIFPDISRNVSSFSDPVMVSKLKRCVAHKGKKESVQHVFRKTLMEECIWNTKASMGAYC